MAEKTMEELFEDFSKSVGETLDKMEKAEGEEDSPIEKALKLEGDSALVKSMGEIKDSLSTIMDALTGGDDDKKVGILDRVEKLESGTAVQKSLKGQDTEDDGDEEPDAEALAKSAKRSLSKGMQNLARKGEGVLHIG